MKCRTKLGKYKIRRDEVGIKVYNDVRWEFLNLLERKRCIGGNTQRNSGYNMVNKILNSITDLHQVGKSKIILPE